MKSYCIMMALSTGILIKRENTDTDTKGELHVMTKTKAGVISLHTKECQRLPVLLKARKS